MSPSHMVESCTPVAQDLRWQNLLLAELHVAYLTLSLVLNLTYWNGEILYIISEFEAHVITIVSHCYRSGIFTHTQHQHRVPDARFSSDLSPELSSLLIIAHKRVEIRCGAVCRNTLILDSSTPRPQPRENAAACSEKMSRPLRSSRRSNRAEVCITAPWADGMWLLGFSICGKRRLVRARLSHERLPTQLRGQQRLAPAQEGK
jgi:hypothetical protein